MENLYKNLYPHQSLFAKDNPNKALLAFDAGTGKTRCAFIFIDKRPGTNFLVIVPKNIKKRWIEDLSTNCPHSLCTVVTKEEFKKLDTKPFTGVVADEADFFSSPLFKKGRSQLSEKLYTMIKDQKIHHILLLTATPYRNNPHNIHTLLTYINKAPLWSAWQDNMYHLVYRPYTPRPFYEPVKNWREKAIAYASQRIYSAKMSDIVTVPTQHETDTRIKTVPLAKITADTPVGAWHERARRESGGKEKIDFIEDYVRDKSKVVIVARYKDQIKDYCTVLQKQYQVYTLTGETKDQEKVIHLAENDPECILIIQADIGAGFEIPSFSYMVFANLSFSHRSYVQMKGRINRINRLKENYYLHLIGGKCDESVYKNIIEMEQDFNL